MEQTFLNCLDCGKSSPNWRGYNFCPYFGERFRDKSFTEEIKKELGHSIIPNLIEETQRKKFIFPMGRERHPI